MKKVSILLCMFFTMFIFASCSGNTETPEQATTNALNAVKSLNKQEAEKYFTYSDLIKENSSKEDLLENEETLKLMLKNLNFKILSSDVKNDSAVVKAEITSIDMKPILGEYISQAFSTAMSNAFVQDENNSEDDEMEQIFIDLLKNEDNKLLTSVVDVKLTKVEGVWKLDMDESLKDAIFGGLISSTEGFGGGNKLNEINNYIVGDLWNEGFCDIDSYLKIGKNSVGKTMDIDLTLTQLDESMSKKPEYDTYINGLEDEKYSNLKMIWGKLSSEIDRLYGLIKAKKPTANASDYEFDTGLFSQYLNAFSDEISKLDE
ncbi:putative lipoprotein [Gottschalkia acidurici 9a]|uniref:Lipoprotein n=1 Tax=Gottschalkia acidurici (strain ATCC 7906 / DSM 604 / BCRC 14475 / CIP 104303 / KCTC 5404 / NCIMB 10678 / 9a) TaxID=1128398 RepID=K0B2N8_GOTA9|nr:hypothetical protein [Gottschalkia acidurici]AFS79205.1 putative lipoprotein [Gottschalkia acidurici 9a]